MLLLLTEVYFLHSGTTLYSVKLGKINSGIVLHYNMCIAAAHAV